MAVWLVVRRSTLARILRYQKKEDALSHKRIALSNSLSICLYLIYPAVVLDIPHPSRTNFGLRLVYRVGLGLGLEFIFV